MASTQTTNVLPKKSFAQARIPHLQRIHGVERSALTLEQVAAAANVPIISKEKPITKPNQGPILQPPVKGANGLPIPRQELVVKPVVDGISNDIPQSDSIVEKPAEMQHLNGLLQRVHLQEIQPRLALSDDTFKKETDAKSITSRTTLTLDEKESLRPDDSASVQAAAEEDAFSPSGSVVAGYREGSDPDARAFRDQLNVIDRTGAAGIIPQQLPAAVVVPALESRNGGIVYPVPATAPGTFIVSEGTRVVAPQVGLGELVSIPDEKLLEALASPKDRLFVLKIEQDMIDFVRDSQ